jgi:hypothetical protein
MGLSDPVARAVAEGARAVVEIVYRNRPRTTSFPEEPFVNASCLQGGES